MNPKITIMRREIKINTNAIPNSKKLSLTKISQKNISMKKDQNLTLPGIGHRFVMELRMNRLRLSKNDDQSIQQSQRKLSIQKPHQFPSVHTNNIQTSKKNLIHGNKRQNNRIELNQVKNSDQDQNRKKQDPNKVAQSIGSSIQLKEENNILFKKTIFLVDREQTPIKEFASIAIQTTQSGLNKETYEEFLKFSITKKTTFQKFKHLINYMEALAGLEQQNFQNNQSNLNLVIQNNPLDDREKRVQQLMNDLTSSKSSFSSLFKQYFIKERIMVKDLKMNLNLFSNQISNLFKQAENKILQSMLEKQVFKSQISPKNVKEIFVKISNTQFSIFEEKNRALNSIMNDFYINYSSLEQKYATWFKNSQQQFLLIKSCVNSILKLPELTINLFGDGKDQDHDQTNDQIKRYCMNGKVLPHISDFFMKRGQQNEREIDEIFSKCCEVKCMNCIYMRSKLRLIYDKNKELKPIIKALWKLTEKRSCEESSGRRFTKVVGQQ